MFILSLFVQISYCHQSTKKGEIVRAYLSLSYFGDWWQCFCRLIVCIEYFRHFITRHKTFWCPSKTIEDGIFLCFFSVDLSHRKVVLLRGGRFGKVWVESSRTHLLLCTAFPLALWSILRLFSSMQIVVLAELGHAALLLLGAVVPQALVVVPGPGTVVPQAPTVVPLLWSCSTVAPGRALLWL